MSFLSYVVAIIVIGVIFLSIYLANREQINENPVEFAIAIAIFIGIFVLTNVLAKYVAVWLGYTFFGLCAAGLLGYYIYRRVT